MGPRSKDGRNKSGGTAHVRYRFDEDLKRRRNECACILYIFHIAI